ncbi:MAG: hypothetical protein Q8L89_08860 [Gammaproteobacteria bacterium]|nr:hypothetical protein [Gammaproteobacteria bacterium]
MSNRQGVASQEARSNQHLIQTFIRGACIMGDDDLVPTLLLIFTFAFFAVFM